MGCDIHMFAEVRKERTKRLYPKGTDTTKYTETTWDKVGKKFPNKYYRPDDLKRTGEDFYAKYTDRPYTNRNYAAFAFLNDVRNEWAITPLKTLIADWREDLPRGTSDEVKLEYLQWGEDAHSLRWLTVEELLEADWQQKIRCSGVLTPLEADEFVKNNESPASFCGRRGGTQEMLLEDWLELDIADRYEKAENDMFTKSVRVNWAEPLIDIVGDLHEAVMNLKKLADKEGVTYDDVRVIFWFDN